MAGKAGNGHRRPECDDGDGGKEFFALAAGMMWWMEHVTVKYHKTFLHLKGRINRRMVNVI